MCGLWKEHTCNDTGGSMCGCEKNTHAMTLAVVHEKNTHAMTLVDPYVVCDKNRHAMNSGGSICCL